MHSSLSWAPNAMPVADKHEEDEEGGQPGTAVSRASTQRASVAQLLLVARLKARNRRDLAVDTLERGAHVMWVTCKSWFSSGGASTDSDSNKDTDTDAHRDR